MNRVEKVAKRVYGILRGLHHNVKTYDDSGNETVDFKSGRYFYSEDPVMMIFVNERTFEIELTISRKSTIDDTKLLRRHLRNIANRYMFDFTVKNYGKDFTPRDFSDRPKVKESIGNISEATLSSMYGKKMVSYQDIGNVRINIRHNESVDPTIQGSRSRNIKELFLEHNGERWRLPSTELKTARALARHVYQGGRPGDEVYEHIIGLGEKYSTLKESIYDSHRNLSESENFERVISALNEALGIVKYSLSKISGVRGYGSFMEAYQDRSNILNEETDEVANIVNEEIGEFVSEGAVRAVTSIMSNGAIHTLLAEQLSRGPVALSRPYRPISKDLITDQRAAMVSEIKELSEHVVDDQLSDFLNKISNKINEGKMLNRIETGILNNVTKNMYVESEIQDEEGECILESYSRQFDKYLKI